MKDEDKKLSEEEKEGEHKSSAYFLFGQVGRMREKRRRMEKEEAEEAKRKKEEQFRRSIEETKATVENLAEEKWFEFDIKYMQPIQETLQYVKDSLGDLNQKQQALTEYVYHESYHRRLVNTIEAVVKVELRNEFDAKLEELEQEKMGLVDLLHAIEDAFEAMCKLVEKRISKKPK